MSRRWWEQVGIDLEGAQKRAAELTTKSATESEEESDEPNEIARGGEEESQGVIGSSEADRSRVEDG